jgi:hypothetical protein
MLSSRQMHTASAKVLNIFETKEDFEEKDKIIVFNHVNK